MSDDAIENILKKAFNDYYDYITEKDIIKAAHEYSEKTAFKEAAQQLRQYIDKEIIGEDEPFSMHGGQSWEFKNQLRAEQRYKLREPME
jgi:DNA topoisomerase IB